MELQCGFEDSLITMIFGVGAAVAAFPPVMDLCVSFLGRKGAVIAGGAIFCLGSGLQALACNMTMMLMGRVIAGFSVGLLSGNAPVYTSEIAPPKLRGALVTGFQFAITAAWLSLKFAKAVDVVLGHCHDDCFDMFACRIILHNSMPQSGVFCKVGIMLAFLLALVLEDVEKPYGGWIVPGLLLVFGGMVMPGSPQYLVAQGKPNEALKMLLKLRSQDVRVELAQILQEHEAESATHTSWGEFLSGDNLKLLGIGVSIQLLQQLCGMNAFMYDGPLIFNKLFGSEHAGRLFTLVSGVVNIFATIPGLFLVDRYGRTLLMKWSAIGMMICSAVLASVGDVCFQDEESSCGDWAKWTATVAICGFILNFAYGWGGMAWVYCAEMFPQKHRTKGVAATTDANWVGNILIAFLPPIMFANWGFNTFWLFVGTNCLCFFCAVSLPETKEGY
ncbi:Sugar transport protein MST3 (Monosaccharide transporter 3) (OsMST3) (Sugar:proton symporter MST3) [Durusdinium trenchii]|uniref:Hexose transporter 1 n=1 Tax=Durusdinium trenchii TaxID=1381693 RepID=A0ABP0ICP6_9DINO